MAAFGVLQESRDSPSTLLLRFASLHSHISSTEDGGLEDEAADFYQTEFDFDFEPKPAPAPAPAPPPVASSSRAPAEVCELLGLVSVEPLRIRKRRPYKGRYPDGSAGRNRRGPPRSPRSPRSTPNNPASSLPPAANTIRADRTSALTADSNSPFTSLGQNFLSMRIPDPETPLVHLPQRPAATDAAPVEYHTVSSPPRKISLAASELHLGLGRFTIWDGDIAPGPSPPVTPHLSPVRRTFSAPQQAAVPDRSTQVHSSEPMTPSRAGSKALQFLGTLDPAMKKFATSVPDGPKVKKRDHFRPLPSGVVRELDAIFGRARTSKHSKHSARVDPRSRTVKPLPSVPITMAERQIGQGNTVEVVDSNGQVWHDLEEQAEFAWLLSEQGRGVGTVVLVSPVKARQPPCVSPSASSPESCASDQQEGYSQEEDATEEIQVRIDGSSDSDCDDPFGVCSKWRNVYDVPKPHKAPFVLGSKAASTLGVAPGEAASRGLAFLSSDPYAVNLPKGRRLEKTAAADLKRRPPPLRLGVAAALKPVNTVAIQQEFVSASFSPNVAETIKFGAIQNPHLNRDDKRSTTTYAKPRSAPTPPRIVQRGNPTMTSFLSGPTSPQGTGLASMTRKMGGMFRKAS